MSQPKLHYMKTATTRPRIHCSSGRFRDSGFASPAHRLFRPHGDREARSWPSRASSHCLSDFSRSKLALRATSYVVLVSSFGMLFSCEVIGGSMKPWASLSASGPVLEILANQNTAGAG
jgi:hypothetical protein